MTKKVINIDDKQRERKYGTTGERMAGTLQYDDEDFLHAMRDQDSPSLEQTEEEDEGFAWVLKILEKDSAEA